MSKIQQHRNFEEHLRESFPTLFSETHEDNFSCPVGWQHLVEGICIQLSNTPDYEKLRCVQIKEKFGGLRFYVSTDNNLHKGTDEQTEILDKGEEESYRTCESCGSKENIGRTRNGWLSTICESCWKDPNLSYHKNPTWKKI